jgi:hypothetical protein
MDSSVLLLYFAAQRNSGRAGFESCVQSSNQHTPHDHHYSEHLLSKIPSSNLALKKKPIYQNLRVGFRILGTGFFRVLQYTQTKPHVGMNQIRAN